MYLSYWQDVSSGATIVLLEAAMFVVTLLATSALKRRPSWTDQSIPALATDRPADDFA